MAVRDERLNLNAALVFLNRAHGELKSIDLRTLPPEPRAEIRELREQVWDHVQRVKLLITDNFLRQGGLK
jgi:hypothetical protein